MSILSMSAIPAPHKPSPLEADHIKQALEASQTAMDAIGTVTTVASMAMTVMAFIVGVIAIFGYSAVKEEARSAAERLANKRLGEYIKSKEFNDYMRDRIDRSVEAKWQERQISRIDEQQRVDGNDEQPFPSAPGDK